MLGYIPRQCSCYTCSSVCIATRIRIYNVHGKWLWDTGFFCLGGKFSRASMKPVNDVHVYINERCRMKKERSKQGQTNNRAKQHSTPQCTYNVYIYDGL